MPREVSKGLDRSHVAGSYLVNIASPAVEGTPVAVLSFAEGGVVMSTASDVPNTTFLGQWSADGGDGFVGSYISFSFGSDGTYEGTAEIVINGRVKDDQISGNYKAVGMKVEGGELFPSEMGSFEGFRVRPKGGNI